MKASVAILSWNAAEKLERAARSALDQTSSDVDVVVVDNGSTDGSAELLPHLERLGCRTIQNPVNLGYAEGMNVGYQASSAEVFVPMNCDAVLHPQFIARALDVLDAHPRVGILGALVYRLDDNEPPWCAPGTPAPPVDGFAIGLRRSMRAHLLSARSGFHRSFKVNGACPVLRRTTIEDVRAAYGEGPFDPVFDSYGEDMDLAFKAWGLGWETAVSDTLVAVHERSYGERRRIYDRRGRLRVNSIAARHLNAWRHLPRSALAVTAPLLVAGDLGLVARQFLRGDWSAARDLATAWARVWRQRHALGRHRMQHPPLPAEVLRTFDALGGS